MHIFLVRQPIFDRQQQVFAYELQCHPSRDNSVSGVLAALSPSIIVEKVLSIGLTRITGGKKVFIASNANAVAAFLEFSLPAAVVVIQRLEDVPQIEAFTESCRKLKAAGYQLALGECGGQVDGSHPILELVDYVRIDLRKLDSTAAKVSKEQAVSRTIDVLAYGVETHEDFNLALEAGCAYFQGNFFCHAAIVSGKELPNYKLNHLRILNELHRKDLDFWSLETVIRQDATLTYKLLNCVNSVYFGLRPTVSSIHHALTLLGEHEIRKWASLVILRDLAEHKPAELLVASLVRAHFCGLLASLTGFRENARELFLMGLLSLLDVMVERPMDEIIQDLPLSQNLKTALVGGRNRYREILDLVLNYEKGDLEQFLLGSLKLRVDEGLITDLYLQSIDLTEKAMQLYGSRPF